MSNTGHKSFKMGTTQRNDLSQGMFVQWLHDLLRDAKGRALLRTLLKQYELPVIQLSRRERKTRSARSNRHAAE